MNIAPSPLERLNRAVYLTFVETQLDNNYKISSKKEFEEKLRPYLKETKHYEYDKTYQHRLADSKETWLNGVKNRIGFIFRENGVESYWILADYQITLKMQVEDLAGKLMGEMGNQQLTKENIYKILMEGINFQKEYKNNKR